VVLYFEFSRIGVSGVISLVAVGVLLFRSIRNRPHRVEEMFLRKVSKIPEVRLITFQDRRITVVVDRPVAQLYGRINDRLRICNRMLYSGQPMTVSILHEVSREQFHQMLASPGVQFVRAEVVEKS
jgi:hypothetical protein